MSLRIRSVMIIIGWRVAVSVQEHGSKAKNSIQPATRKEYCCQRRPETTTRRQLHQDNRPKKPATNISYSKQRRTSGPNSGQQHHSRNDQGETGHGQLEIPVEPLSRNNSHHQPARSVTKGGSLFPSCPWSRSVS